MTFENNQSATEGRRDRQACAEIKGTLALHDKLDRLMAKSKPSRRAQVQLCFRELYPKLEAYLTQGRPLKDVLAAFNELAQAKVCARTFNDMLDEERGHRGEHGNPACCAECGQPLRLVPSGDPPATNTYFNMHSSALTETKVES